MRDGPTVIIDLGVVDDGPGPEPRPSRPWTPRRLRPAAVGMAAALLLISGGAAAPAGPDLVETVAVPVGANIDHLLTGDRLFVSSVRTDPGERTFAAYDLREGRQLWSFTRTAAQDNLTVRRLARVARLGELQHVDGTLLIARSRADNGLLYTQTDAVTADTGELRWSVPYRVEVLDDGRTGLAVTESFPEGSAVRPMLGERPPVTYEAATGQSYGSPPEGVRVQTVDLTSGALLWTSGLLDSATVLPSRPTDGPPGGDPGVLVVADGGVAELRDARSGAVRLRFTDAGPGVTGAQPVGDLLLLWRPGRVYAYSMRTWQRLWVRDLTDGGGRLGGCGVLLCEWGTDVHLIDAGTGQRVGQLARAGRQWLARHAGHLIEFGAEQRPLRTVHPDDGRWLIDLTGWQEFSGGGSDVAPAVLTRGASEGTWFGLLEPGAGALRVLGPVAYPVESCRAGLAHIACRTGDSGLRVWRYRR